MKLQSLSPLPLEVVWHENESSYISARKGGGKIVLRLHKLFENAPTPVLQAIIQFALKGDSKSRAIIRQMAHLYFSKKEYAPKDLVVNGQTYDLKEILERVNLLLNIEGITIGWATKGGGGKFRSITFGTYDAQRRQIRINPILDRPEVPLYFIEFIVYHELLHAIFPVEMDGTGRRTVHSREFRERERQFPQYSQAKDWKWQDIVSGRTQNIAKIVRIKRKARSFPES